jgi:peptide/nickel transport system ATP-binding protein
MIDPLVRVQDLTVQFTGQRKASALNHVSFELAKGEVLGLLGESGSGKSVTLRTLMRLHPERTTQMGGVVQVAGQDVLQLKGRKLDQYRGAMASMVFQEPGLAFDPVYTIGQQMVEAIQAHEGVDTQTALRRSLQMLERVQIPQANRRLNAYPHELSGGMRQRAMIALSLVCRPQLLLADEPTTALDATVQIQILLLLRELQKETGMSVIFVTHDIGAAVEVADRIAVMYAGRIVEMGDVAQIVAKPRHPYTQGLLASTVKSEDKGKPLMAVPGSPPDLANLPPGCCFAARCANASLQCQTQIPPSVVNGSSSLACWHPVSWSEGAK